MQPFNRTANFNYNIVSRSIEERERFLDRLHEAASDGKLGQLKSLLRYKI